ncbi:hypothetical protein BESB_024320 [Besnoitia besnoiti]|uniref:Uncharacterized protein n=1 Tax=Besnoitia besnoiti TaxID=94643 RepID=A0A2A9M982_BESBE|nr:hypothetical protein BESB_024320 [Besnoitia besnoiti]PFH31940.1 hypothetical protein BESB_024320 [Besnoitia besnoiti]
MMPQRPSSPHQLVAPSVQDWSADRGCSPSSRRGSDPEETPASLSDACDKPLPSPSPLAAERAEDSPGEGDAGDNDDEAPEQDGATAQGGQTAQQREGERAAEGYARGVASLSESSAAQCAKRRREGSPALRPRRRGASVVSFRAPRARAEFEETTPHRRRGADCARRSSFADAASPVPAASPTSTPRLEKQRRRRSEEAERTPAEHEPGAPSNAHADKEWEAKEGEREDAKEEDALANSDEEDAPPLSGFSRPPAQMRSAVEGA